MIGTVLDAEARPYLALDVDPLAVATARDERLPVYFGDASRAEMLERVHAGAAAAIVVTLDDAAKADRIVQVVRHRWPHVPIHARARHAAHAARLLALGTDEVVQEALEASLQMAGRLLHALGASGDVIHARLEVQRNLELAAMTNVSANPAAQG
jgi:CPA2 family monovalent cation:H+ antiporter-2